MEKEGKGLSKNLIWDKTLFKEGVRQTRWIALVMLIISGASFLEFYYVPICAISSIFLCVMMYRLFKFSNKRSSSDFYNALGKSRISIYISYLSVILMWLFILAIVYILVSSFDDSEYYYVGEQLVRGNWSIKFAYIRWEEIFSYIAYCLLVISAFAVGMASTGNAITHVLATVVILFAPSYLYSFCTSGYYNLLPFITGGNGVAISAGNAAGITYAQVDHISDFYVFQDFLTIGEMIICSVVIAVILFLIAGVLFNKKKSENAGAVALNGFWKFVLRSLIALVIAISADFALVERVFNGTQAEKDMAYIIITYVISVAVWILFDLFTGRNKKKNFKSLVWLPAFIILNVLVVAGVVSTGYKASEVPPISEVDSITIKQTSIDYSDNKQIDAYEKLRRFALLTDEKYMDNEKVKELLYNRWSNDMMRFRNPMINYSMDRDGSDIFLISIETQDEVLERYISMDGYLMQEILAAYLEASENIYDYEIPIRRIENLNTEASIYLGKNDAFTWDFTFEEISEIYNCFYEELSSNTLPLKTVLGIEYNSERVFDYLTYYDESEQDGTVYLPIGVNSPKTLEKLAEISNKKRTDFDFQWLLEYINGIGDKEKGVAIDVFLYTDNDTKIRYEAYSFWSNYTADLSKEKLNQLSEITLAHEEDTAFSAEENILVILYRDIEGVNPTCRWYNISDEEAEIVDDIIWDEGYFDCVNYSNQSYY